MQKNTFKHILAITLAAILFNCLLNNFASVCRFFVFIFSVVSPIVSGCVIAFIIDLPMKKIETSLSKIFPRLSRKASKKLLRCISLSLSLVFVGGVVSALLFFIIPEVFKTVSVFVNQLPLYTQSLQSYINTVFASFDSFTFPFPKPNITGENVISAFNFISDIGKNFVGNTISITTTLFSSVMNLFLGFTFAIYLLLEKEKVKRWYNKIILAFFPAKCASYIITVTSRTDNAFTAFISGQLTEAGILGILCFFGMSLCTFPHALLISVIVSVTALIPVFGAWIGAFLGAFIILLIQPAKSFWFLLFIIVLQQLENNLIYPKVVGQSVGLPALLVLASVTVGGNLFGMVGMLVSVPVFSVLYSVFKDLVDYMQSKKYPD